MKKTKLIVMCLALAICCLCFVADPPQSFIQHESVMSSIGAGSSDAPIGSGSGGIALAAAVFALSVPLVSRRSRLVINSKPGDVRKSIVALANCGVSKLTGKQRRSASNDDEFKATHLLATG